MLHIKPIQEKDASEKVSFVFQDIKQTLNSEVVPLFFRYLANYEDYLLYIWDKIKINVTSDYFQEGVREVHTFVLDGISEIYTPSRSMMKFLAEIHPQEKEQIKETVTKLIALNAQLMLLTIGIREGVKGVHIKHDLLGEYSTSPQEVEEIFGEFSIHRFQQEKEMAAASKMLAPLFGSQALMVSHYPDFFAHVAREMDELVRTESYLTKRVELEHLGLKKISHLPYSLGCSYAEIAHFAAGKPYFSELLYILSETFPSQFPRLVFTSEVMWSLFLPKTNSIAAI